jgi:hypothetical protein
VFQDFEDLGREIEKFCGFYVEVFSTKENLVDIISNVNAKKFKDDLIFREALSEDVLFYEAEYLKQKISIVRKYYHVMKLCFDPCVK